MRAQFKVSIVSLVFCLFAGTALGHEFFVMPEVGKEYAPGSKVGISVYSTHKYVKGEELEDLNKTKVSFAGADVALKANESKITYDGQIELKAAGAAIVEGHRLPIIWSETPTGEGEGGRTVHKDAVRSTRYEKFAKTLLPVGGKTEGFNKKVGHRLEIVPVDNPLAAKPGDEILLKVLLDGKPAKFNEVRATYDGFTDIESAWAFAASPVNHGEAKVRITAPGVWCVMVSVHLTEKTEDYDDALIKAMLIFPVK